MPPPTADFIPKLDHWVPENFEVNPSPVIGVIAQRLSDSMSTDELFEGKTRYIQQSYVTFLEAAGARVVPILSNEDEEVTKEKLANLNGVLFPGGSKSYMIKARQIYAHAIERNNAGEIFPIFGICLGFQALGKCAGDENPLSDLLSKKQSLTLDFLVRNPLLDTHMFATFEDDIYHFSEQGMTYNSHSYGISLDKFTTDAGLAKMFKPTSTSTNPDTQVEFVATMEGIHYPFMGV